jgi:DNA-binding NtrC family response regulator
MMAQGDAIDVPDLPEMLRIEPSILGDWDPDLRSLEEVQRRHIQHVLKIVKDNKAQAAEILGIGRTTLYRFLSEGQGIAENEAKQQNTP